MNENIMAIADNVKRLKSNCVLSIATNALQSLWWYDENSDKEASTGVRNSVPEASGKQKFVPFCYLSALYFLKTDTCFCC